MRERDIDFFKKLHQHFRVGVGGVRHHVPNLSSPLRLELVKNFTIIWFIFVALKMPKGKSKKSMQCKLLDGDSQVSLGSSAMEEKDKQTELNKETDNTNLGLILKELREFRKDNGLQMKII